MNAEFKCIGWRYNPKIGKTEHCQKKESCKRLFNDKVDGLQKECDFINFRFIKDFRNCKQYVEKDKKLSAKEIFIEWIKNGEIKPHKGRTLDDLLTLANNL